MSGLVRLVKGWSLRVAAVATVATVATFGFQPGLVGSGSRDGSTGVIEGTPTERCTAALALVHQRNVWPLECRERGGEDVSWGAAFPPPSGLPPWDRPRIEIYLGPDQDRAGVARAIAHELGHMHHTREAGDLEQAWLRARRLPPATPSSTWTEDYAEVFAALFGPAFDDWRAPTARPSPEALEALRRQFFDVSEPS